MDVRTIHVRGFSSPAHDKKAPVRIALSPLIRNGDLRIVPIKTGDVKA